MVGVVVVVAAIDRVLEADDASIAVPQVQPNAVVESHNNNDNSGLFVK